MNSQPTCDCRNAHKHDEDLEGQGITAIGFDVVNSHEQHCGNDANDDDGNSDSAGISAARSVQCFGSFMVLPGILLRCR